jgi:hypothetical protein
MDGVNWYCRASRAYVTGKHVNRKWARLLTSGRRVADYYVKNGLYEVASACPQSRKRYTVPSHDKSTYSADSELAVGLRKSRSRL